MINMDRPGPPWRQLADDMRERIIAGEWTGRLPAEKTLAQEYGVALGTVRKAMAWLRGEGLIRTDRGWGSYVAGTEPPRNP
jgi:DNA-binding GntR family transcriptional regulator